MRDRNRPFNRNQIKSRIELPEIYMPAMPPLALMEAIVRWVRARLRRRALRQLLALDSRLLQDVGVNRERVLQALRGSAMTSQGRTAGEPSRTDGEHCP